MIHPNYDVALGVGYGVLLAGVCLSNFSDICTTPAATFNDSLRDSLLFWSISLCRQATLFSTKIVISRTRQPFTFGHGINIFECRRR